MIELQLQEYLLKHYPKEDESCEWKEFSSMKHSFKGKEGEDVVSYVSAISNMEGGHLVMGVKDGSLDIEGIDNYNYDKSKIRLRLLDNCANLPSEGLELEEFITEDTYKRVWVLHIPKHDFRQPVFAHNKAWMRVDDSLKDLSISRRNAILSETPPIDDWSAQIIPGATISDLDMGAITFAREKYIELNPSREDEIRAWSIQTFLNKAKLTRSGKITYTTIILLGKEESEHLLLPYVCKIRWSKRTGDIDKDTFEIFSIPMILAIDKVANKITNEKYTYTIQGSMFPETMDTYDVFTLREPLNNAIAHQDYSKQARIEVVEYVGDRLLFRNHGQFIPPSIEDVIQRDFPESRYRNPALVEAMRNIKMVETEGGGIKKLFKQQRKRFFPMPKYDLSNAQVVCEIESRILDENFAKILANNPHLTLTEIILLDKVQRHLPLTEEALELLRKKKFIEGKRPNIYLSASIVTASKHVGLKTSYIKNKSFDDKYYKDLIINYIRQFGQASRPELNQLLYDKLPATLSEKQKFDKVTNLLSSLRKKGYITVNDKRRWFLVSKGN